MSNILTDNIPLLVTLGVSGIAMVKTPIPGNVSITPSTQHAYRWGYVHAAIGAALMVTFLDIRY